MNIPFIKYSKIHYIFSGILALGAVICILIFGLNFGIDFTGGSILEIKFEERPESAIIQERLAEFELGEIIVQPTEEQGIILRLKDINEDTHQQVLFALGEISKVEEVRFESVGPTIGKELRQKTIFLIILSIVAILIYIGVVFRKVSQPLPSWQYGLVSILALFFDVLITVGIFAWLGESHNVQFTIPIVAALLTILGYAINDKVIVFDRIRENLLRIKGEDFDNLVNQSLNQILTRSISTGTCTLLVLMSIFFFGGETLRYFSLALIVGIVVGTYSSLFLASPALVSWLKWKRRV
ncbi:protein translocase subunit SecF [Patescibacteria group bacterium]|nr:protein translocase subunit SecF [Patescibacteria group bacterium]